MAAASAQIVFDARAVEDQRVPGGATFGNVMRSEFRKLATVRSTYWSAVAAIVFMLAFAGAEAVFLPSRLSARSEQTMDAVRVSLGGSHLAQIAFGVLGVLVVSSECTSGMIKATFAAAPRRSLVLSAKTIVFALTTFLIGATASFAAYFLFQALLSGDALRSSISDPGVVRALVGGGLYFAALGLFGLGLGAMLRASSGAIAALFSLLFVPQILAELLPDTWQTSIGRYMPMQAGAQIFSQHSEKGMLSPWGGFGVFCLYAAVALVIGFVLVERRDA